MINFDNKVRDGNTLDLSNWAIQEDIPHLIEFLKITPNITHLNLKHTDIKGKGLRVLAQSKTLGNLTHLNLQSNQINANRAKIIARSEIFSNLSTLNLSFNNIDANGIRAVALSPYLTNVTDLNLYRNNIGNDGLRELMASKNLNKLISLNLGYNGISNDGMEYVANSENLSNLRDLSFRGNNITANGMRELAQSKNLGKLVNLDLGTESIIESYNKIGNEGLIALAQAEILTKLMILNLSVNHITFNGIKALAHSPYLNNLMVLDLRSNTIGDNGARELANSENLGKVHYLDLGYSGINADGTITLAQSPYLTNVTNLILDGNGIGNKELMVLIQSPSLANLTHLSLESNNISDEGVIFLTQSNILNNLTNVNLVTNPNIGAKGIIAAAKSCKNRRQLAYQFDDDPRGTDQRAFNLLSSAYRTSDNNISEQVIKDIIFELAPYEHSAGFIKYFIEHLDEYPFPINTIDKHGNSLSHYFSHDPQMLQLLFEHGYIPKKEIDRDRQLARIAADAHSSHDPEVIARNRFYVEKLMKEVQCNEQELETAALAAINNIQKLDNIYNDKQKTAFLCLPITQEERSSVLAAVHNPEQRILYMTNDQEFSKYIIKEAVKTLTTTQTFRSNEQMMISYQDNKKISLFDSIALVQLLINQSKPSIEVASHLCIDSFKDNAEQVKKNFAALERLMPGCSIENLINAKQCKQLLKDVKYEQLEQLFKIVHDANLLEIWQDQRHFILAKQLYLVGKTYGNRGDTAACPPGTWSRILQTVDDINLNFFDQYFAFKNEKQQQGHFNVIRLVHDNPTVEILKLINFINENSNFKKAFAEIIFDNIDINNSSKEQKEILNKIRILSLENKTISSEIELPAVIKKINQTMHNYDNKETLLADNIIRFSDRAQELINFIEANSKLKQGFVNIVFGNVDVDKSDAINIEAQQIFAKINELYFNPKKLNRLIDNYTRTIPKYEEYKMVIVELTSLQPITNYAQKLDKKLELKKQVLETRRRVSNFIPESRKRRYSNHDDMQSSGKELQEPQKKKILTTDRVRRHSTSNLEK